MIRIVIALLLFAAPAFAQDAKTSRMQRLVLLETRLTLVQQSQAKAAQAHDVWLSGIKNPVDPSIPHNPTDAAAAAWHEALATVDATAKQLYPEQPVALFVMPQTNPFKAVPGDDGLDAATQFEYRQASVWKMAALPQIQGLISRMTNEIAALRTDIANNP